jgi:chromosome segregation ATPase
LVQPILFFLLGFLCAGFLAVLVAPAIWRRAVALTRRRVETSMPLSLSEIQADKDGLRAEFAMSVRKLEMTVKSFREKSAGQMVEIGRVRGELSGLAETRAEQDLALVDLERKCDELRTALSRSEEKFQDLSDRHLASERIAGEGAIELERLGQMYDEASLTASNRQVELMARESAAQKLADEISALREQHKSAIQARTDMEARVSQAEVIVSAEKKRADELSKKLERLMATLADREDKIDRREKELARLRTLPKATGSAAERSGEIEKAIAKLDADRERLETRLTTLARENKKLRAELSAPGQAEPGSIRSELPGATLLREQMHELAAEMVALTARLDGPDSPIAKALTMPGAGPASDESGERMMSLADRVRALQKASFAG